jgi:hypothetical protein
MLLVMNSIHLLLNKQVFDVCEIMLDVGLNWVLFISSKPLHDALQGSLMDLNVSLKWKTTEKQGVGACSLARNTLGVEECARAPGWDWKNDK